MYFLFFRYVKDMFKNKFVYWVCISFKKVCNSESRAYRGGKVPNLPEMFWNYFAPMAHKNFGWVKILPPPPQKKKKKSSNSVGILHDPRPEGGGK